MMAKMAKMAQADGLRPAWATEPRAVYRRRLMPSGRVQPMHAACASLHYALMPMNLPLLQAVSGSHSSTRPDSPASATDTSSDDTSSDT